MTHSTPRPAGELTTAQALSHYAAQAQIAQLVTALDRLASMEAFHVSRAMTNSAADIELQMRMDYARAALAAATVTP